MIKFSEVWSNEEKNFVGIAGRSIDGDDDARNIDELDGRGEVESAIDEEPPTDENGNPLPPPEHERNDQRIDNNDSK